MTALPRKSFHAMEAVLHIACSRSAAPVSSKEIAATQSLPPRYLEQMLQKLVRSGILRGVRGPRGGYLLAREKRRITMGEIYRMIEEDEDGLTPAPDGLGEAVLLPIWQSIHEQTIATLSAITLSDCCDKADKFFAQKQKNAIFSASADFAI